MLSHYNTGVVRQITPIRRGAGGSIKWAVLCEQGPMLLRRRPQGVDEQTLAMSRKLQVQAATQGVPIPKPIALRAGAEMLRLDGRLYEMARFVPSAGFDQSVSACRAAGSMLGGLHSMFRNVLQPREGAADARGFHRALRVQTELVGIASAGKAAMGTVTRSLGALYSLAGERASAAGADQWPVQIVHGDWHPGNLLFDGPTVVGVLDFDSIRIAPRAFEVAYGALQFSLKKGEGSPDLWPHEADLDRLREFVRGYESTAESVLSRAEVAGMVWLMIEALIAEAVGPIAQSGEFGGIDGKRMLKMIENKAGWLRDNQSEISLRLG